MRINLIIPVSAALSFGAVAPRLAAQEKIKEATEALQTALYDLSDKDSAFIKFPAHSHKLSAAQISELKTTFNAFRNDAQVKEIVIVSYSDKPYPHSSTKGLSKSDRQLAANRGEAVKKELSALGGKNIQVYNMAESANWFERLMVASDAQVKREAKEQAANQTREDAFLESLGRHLLKTGGPSKVVVVMRHDAASAVN